MVVRFLDKAHPVDRWNGVITGRGSIWGTVRGAELAENYESFDDFIAHSGPVLEREHKANIASGFFTGQSVVEVLVAGWSEAEDRPKAFTFRSPTTFDTESERAPYVWRPLFKDRWIEERDRHADWRLHRQAAQPDIDWTAETFDPAKHGLPVMEELRQKFHDGSGYAPAAHIVGGYVLLTIVDREGTRQGVIREWSDEVGEMIRPAPMDETALPMIAPSHWPDELHAAFPQFMANGLVTDDLELDYAAVERFNAAHSPAPAANGNRKQRLAAKAQARKGRAYAA